MTASRFSASLLVVFACGAFAPSARAETVNCTAITALPAIINQSGVYCLRGDLSTAMPTGYAIEVRASSVVLDLNGFKLAGRAAGAGTITYGIYALNRSNITVKNGTVRGFHQGVVLEVDAGVSKGHVVEDIRADLNTFVGINVQGTGCIVRNNQVVEIGGSTVFGPNAPAFGIYITGTGQRVLNNDISNITSQGLANSIGIVMTVIDGLAVNNRITAVQRGISMGSGKYRDNLTSSVSIPYFGGTDAGNND